MITTKQLTAVLAVTALLAVGVIGVGYAYTASTENSDNTATIAYLKVEQSGYRSDLDATGNFNYDTTTAYYDANGTAGAYYEAGTKTTDPTVQYAAGWYSANPATSATSITEGDCSLQTNYVINNGYEKEDISSKVSGVTEAYIVGSETVTVSHSSGAIPEGGYTLTISVADAAAASSPVLFVTGYTYYAVLKDANGLIDAKAFEANGTTATTYETIFTGFSSASFTLEICVVKLTDWNVAPVQVMDDATFKIEAAIATA